MTTCACRCFDRLERRHEQALEPFQRSRFGRDDLLVAVEQPVEESAQHLVDHLLLGREVVIETAGQDSRRVGDVTNGRGPQPAVGEHRRGELEQLARDASGAALSTSPDSYQPSTC